MWISSSSSSSLRCRSLLPSNKTGSTVLKLSAVINSSSSKFLSTITTDTSTLLPQEDDPLPAVRQPFVQARIRAGEWNPERTNPLYRPKFKARAKILSAEDRAKAPEVVANATMKNFQEAGVTMCWLDQADCRQIYNFYLDLMQHGAAKHKNLTSHEYTIRVVAQKFNLIPDRVAAIVLLQHNEQQMLKAHPELAKSTLAATLEADIKIAIEKAYEHGETPKPDEFVEERAIAPQEKRWTVVEDVFDVEQLTGLYDVKEEERARKIIDGYVYIEDKDEDQVTVPLTSEAKALLRNREKMEIAAAASASASSSSSSSIVEWPKPMNNTKEHRKPWKFVAHVITGKQKTESEKKKRSKNKRNEVWNGAENIITEENGVLRAGTLADVRYSPWNGPRNVQEHIYREAKLGWLEKMNRGNDSAWGIVADVPVATLPIEETSRTEANEGQSGNVPPMFPSDDESDSDEMDYVDPDVTDFDDYDDDDDDDRRK